MPPVFELDALLHQPIRTQIVAYLGGRESASFSELKKQLGSTDGNLEAHLKKLLEYEYLCTEKDTTTGRVTTLYLLTETGRTALRRYIEELTAVIQHTGMTKPERKKRAVVVPGQSPLKT